MGASFGRNPLPRSWQPPAMGANLPAPLSNQFFHHVTWAAVSLDRDGWLPQVLSSVQRPACQRHPPLHPYHKTVVRQDPSPSTHRAAASLHGDLC